MAVSGHFYLTALLGGVVACIVDGVVVLGESLCGFWPEEGLACGEIALAWALR